MSASLGVCRPSSIRETLDWSQPSNPASALPVRSGSAARRNSRSRAPRASRACWTSPLLDTPFILPVDLGREGVVPRGVPPRVRLNDPYRVLDLLHLGRGVALVVMQHVQAGGVEQPVVHLREPGGLTARQVADVLAGLDVVAAHLDPVPRVVRPRFGDHPYPLHAHTG